MLERISWCVKNPGACAGAVRARFAPRAPPPAQAPTIRPPPPEIQRYSTGGQQVRHPSAPPKNQGYGNAGWCLRHPRQCYDKFKRRNQPAPDNPPIRQEAPRQPKTPYRYYPESYDERTYDPVKGEAGRQRAIMLDYEGDVRSAKSRIRRLEHEGKHEEAQLERARKQGFEEKASTARRKAVELDPTVMKREPEGWNTAVRKQVGKSIKEEASRGIYDEPAWKKAQHLNSDPDPTRPAREKPWPSQARPRPRADRSRARPAPKIYKKQRKRDHVPGW